MQNPSMYYIVIDNIVEHVLTISVDMYRPNLRQLAADSGWDSSQPLRVIFNGGSSTEWQHIAGPIIQGPFNEGLHIEIGPTTFVGGLYNSGVCFTHTGTPTPFSVVNYGRMWAAGGYGGPGGAGWVCADQGSLIWGYAGDGGSGQGFNSGGSQELYQRKNIVAATAGQPGGSVVSVGPTFGSPNYVEMITGHGGHGGSWGIPGDWGGYAVVTGDTPSGVNIGQHYGIQEAGAGGTSRINAQGVVMALTNYGDVKGAR